MERENNIPQKESFKFEKLWLAIIPVVGSIIIAIITNGFTCEQNNSTSSLKNQAGKINEMTVYGNYDDLLPLLSEGIKTQVTREIFIHAVKTNKDSLGNYIKTLDTTENTMRGGKYYYVKNQHERGRSVVVVSFDDHEKIIALFYDKVPK